MVLNEIVIVIIRSIHQVHAGQDLRYGRLNLSLIEGSIGVCRDIGMVNIMTQKRPK